MTCNTSITNNNYWSESVRNFLRMVRYYLKFGHSLKTAIKLTWERRNEFQHRNRKH